MDEIRDIREKLKPFLGKRIKVRGSLVAFGDFIQNYRDVGMACISMPEVNGEIVADHVWVTWSQHWLKHKADMDKQVEFTALVDQYDDRKLGQTNYCLTHPDELTILHAPPALKIPEAPTRKELSMSNLKPTNGKPEVATDPLETLRQVKAFIQAVGGQKHATSVVGALEAVTIPIPDLISWVKTLAA